MTDAWQCLVRHAAQGRLARWSLIHGRVPRSRRQVQDVPLPRTPGGAISSVTLQPGRLDAHTASSTARSMDEALHRGDQKVDGAQTSTDTGGARRAANVDRRNGDAKRRSGRAKHHHTAAAGSIPDSRARANAPRRGFHDWASEPSSESKPARARTATGTTPTGVPYATTAATGGRPDVSSPPTGPTLPCAKTPTSIAATAPATASR